ncbi:MAG: reprolysin-like metallopeptidase, partial [Myxococcota bacterium]
MRRAALFGTLVCSVAAVACGDTPAPDLFESGEVLDAPVSTAGRLTEYGGQVTTLRLAVAATQQHAAQYSDLTDLTDSIDDWVDGLNAFFVPALSVEFDLVANDGSLVSDSAFDALSQQNGNASSLAHAGRTWLSNNLGAAQYDIGVTLGSAAAGSGLSGLSAIDAYCNSNQGRFGIQTPRLPVVSSFADRLLHFFGHSLGAFHTFNAVSGPCATSRSATYAVEPGAGNTIMSNAGLCSPNNAGSFLRQFHSTSLDRITDVLASKTNCGTVTEVRNSPPNVTVAVSRAQIPARTSFQLEGSATDEGDEDTLRFTWEQVDIAGQPSALSDGDLGDVPLFRVFPASPSPSRTFPFDPLNPEIGEILPTTERTLTFRLLATDLNPTGGAFSSAETTLFVTATAGPFVQTTANTDWVTGTETVSWDVANTDIAPVSCANVDITLSVDGGASFDTILAADTPNDGSESIDVPALISSDAIVRVKCSSSVFFADLAIILDGTQCSTNGECDDGNVCN